MWFIAFFWIICTHMLSKIIFLSQLGLHLNVTDVEGVSLFIYNENQERNINFVWHCDLFCLIPVISFLQMFVPNYRKIYGSQHTSLHPKGGFERGKHYFYKVELTKYHLIALDQPSERCASKKNHPTTSSCITKFIERELGCSPRIYGVDNLTQKNYHCNSSQILQRSSEIDKEGKYQTCLINDRWS